MKIVGIYKITSPSGKNYIGQSRDINRRFSKYRGLNCKTQHLLYRSFIKYGFENHIFEIIEECDIHFLNIKERYWQDFYDVLNSGLNLILTETNEKVRVVSNETREKLRKNFLNKNHTEETKEKMRLFAKNRINSEETKKKMSESRLGKKYSDETRSKMSIINKINKNVLYLHSKESRIKSSESRKKIILNIETGIFYIGVEDAAISMNMNMITLRSKLNGSRKNDTQFLYV